MGAEVDRLADATGRSTVEVVDAALRVYIASENEFLAAVEEAKEGLRQGRMTDHADVVAVFNRMIGAEPQALVRWTASANTDLAGIVD